MPVTIYEIQGKDAGTKPWATPYLGGGMVYRTTQDQEPQRPLYEWKVRSLNNTAVMMRARDERMQSAQSTSKAHIFLASQDGEITVAQKSRVASNQI